MQLNLILKHMFYFIFCIFFVSSFKTRCKKGNAVTTIFSRKITSGDVPTLSKASEFILPRKHEMFCVYTSVLTWFLPDHTTMDSFDKFSKKSPGMNCTHANVYYWTELEIFFYRKESRFVNLLHGQVLTHQQAPL